MTTPTTPLKERTWFRVLKYAGIGLSLLTVKVVAVGLFLAYSHFNATPVELYQRALDATSSMIYDPAELKDWKQWEHRFDNEIITTEDAVKKANEALKTIDDPHTVMLTPDQAKAERQGMEGKFIGVGIMLDVQVDEKGEPLLNEQGKPFPKLDENGYAVIKEVIKGSGAAKAGVQDGDAITAINGESTKGLSLDLIIGKIRGPEGGNVKFDILRDGQEVHVEVIRMAVVQSSVSSKMLEGDVGYIRLDGFNQYKNTDDVKAAIQNLDSAKAFVFDLRNNPGGLVPNAISISSLFVEQGTLVVIKSRIPGNAENPQYSTKTYRVEGNELITETVNSTAPEAKTVSKEARTPYLMRGRPVVVLINGGSASASEMTTGALQDNGVATVMGEKSFGKGIGQSVFPMANGTSIHITSLRYYSPSGKWFGDAHKNKAGIQPDIVVKPSKKRMEFGSPSDNQLQSALEHLNKKLGR